MADEHEQPPQMEPLGPAYEALQRRLLDDGAAWRVGLPSTERLEQHLHGLKDQERAARFSASPASQGRLLQFISPSRGEYTTMFQGRMRAALALTTIAVVVVLFAVLFYGFANHKPGTTANPNSTQKTATPTSVATPFPTQQQYDSFFPAVAPSNPQVVYKLASANGASGQLARSTDGGATWKTFALPKVTGGTTTPLVVFVSPLDPQTVFLTVSVELASGTPGFQACPQSVKTSGLSSYAALSGGTANCAVEFVSKDGGAHWSQAHLPASAAPAALGDTSGYIFPTGFWLSSGATVFHVQGNRLYSTTNVEPGSPPDSPEAQSTPTIRIVVSTDGGLNWSYADNALASANGIICDYAASPSGSTLFAITSAGCNREDAPPSFLWRSDDAGAHWAELGQLPGNAIMGMTAVSRGSGQMPLLYLDMAQETCTTSGGYVIRPNAGGCNLDASPANVRVSADGGKTWKSAPTKGFPTVPPDNMLENPGTPLGVLSDGSVLFLARAPDATNNFYAWKLGDTSWHKVGPDFTNVVSSFVVPGAQHTVCAVTQSASGFEVHTFSA